MPLLSSVPRVIGHRGSARLAPENTLASIRRAHADGVRWVEFDVKLTADGVPILMHDDTLDRTTNGSGAVAAHTLARIAELDAGSWWGPAFAGERVPTFGAALHLLRRLGLGANVEIKACPGREIETGRAVAAALADGWQAHLPPPLLSSFSPEALEAARDAAPMIRRGMLVHDRRAEWRELAERVGAVAVHTFHGFVTPEMVAAYPLLAYTVNDAGLARRMFDLGVCAVFSDVPGYLLSVLATASRQAE